MSILSIIVARAGSKGLPKKVVQKINTKYVFEYSLDYSLSLDSYVNDDVVTATSSDCDEIRDYCAERNLLFVPRLPEHANDNAPINDAMYHVYQTVDQKFDYISLLYGNVPTRYPDEFVKAYNFLQDNDEYDATLSMQNAEKYNPAWMFPLDAEVLPLKEKLGHRRQDLPQYMFHDGHTILIRSRYFLDFFEKKKKSTYLLQEFGACIKPVLNTKVIIDIDTQKDLLIASALLAPDTNAAV